MKVTRENCKLNWGNSAATGKIEIFIDDTHKVHFEWLQLTPAMHLRESLVGQIISANNCSIDSDGQYYRLRLTLKSPMHNPAETNWRCRNDFHSEKLNLATAVKLWDIVCTN